MTVIVKGSDPVIDGTANADIIFQRTTTGNPVTINGGGGNDVLIGNRGSVTFPGAGTSPATAVSVDDPALWSRAVDALVGNSSFPYTSILGTGANALNYVTVTVGARETLTADVDFAFGGFGGPSWDSRIQLLAGDGTTVLADNDDSDISQGGVGSIANSATSSQDSYLHYTNTGAAPVTLYIVVGAFQSGNGLVAIPAGDNYLLNLTVTGHDNAGALPVENVTLNGDEGNDFLLGNIGADTITGGVGNDRLYGGEGNDTFVIRTGDGTDTVDGGTGDDTLDLTNATSAWQINLAAGGGNDGGGGIVLTSGIDRVLGTALGDTLIASNASESLFGLGGDDIIVASNILDNRGTLDGGDGIDTLDLLPSVEAADDYNYPYTINLTTGTTSEGDVILNFENLISGATADIVTGTDGDNIISTGVGDDTVNAGRGDDTIDTGSDDDTIIIGTGDGHDTIDGGLFTDTLDLTTATDGWYINLRNGMGSDHSGDTLVLNSIEIVRGSDKNDTLIASDGIDPQFVPALYGFGGDDMIVAGRTVGGPLDGGRGIDTIDLQSVGGSNQPFTIDLASGTTDRGDIILNFENVISGVTADHVTGTAKANIITTNAGDDYVAAGSGDDTIDAGDGADTLDGGKGADTMSGGKGDDVYFVDNAGDSVSEFGRSGNDTVHAQIDYTLGANVENLMLSGDAHAGTGNALANRIGGGTGADTLSGLGGDDTILGGRGADTIAGGIGDDTISGGVGADTLTGGRGMDSFAFANGDSGRTLLTADRIADFKHADGDRIDLAAFDAVSGTPANEAFRFIGTAAFSNSAGQLRYEFAGTDTIIQGDTNGDGRADLVITLTGQIALALGDFTGVGAADGAPLGDAALV